MRVRNPLRVTAAAAALVLGLAACGGGDGGGEEGNTPEAGGSEAAQPSGQPGGTYSAELTEPSYLAPANMPTCCVPQSAVAARSSLTPGWNLT